ncbi:MAG: DUF4129 domain-containing protein [Euryarchaeota archaeon]|nr:DUF4129 domain-containing protein [Euryarchaeota archaeon]
MSTGQKATLLAVLLAGAMLAGSLAYNVEHLKWGPEEEPPQGYQAPPDENRVTVDHSWVETVRWLLIAVGVIIAVIAVLIALWGEEATRAKIAKAIMRALVQIVAVALLVAVLYTVLSLRFGDPNAPLFQSVRWDWRTVTDNLLVVASIIVLAVAAVAIAWFALRREKAGEDLGEIVISRDEAAAIITGAIKEIEEGAGLRAAVLRCYSSMVKLFDDKGVRLRPQMTPREFEGAVRNGLKLQEESLTALTRLFEEARYSTHEITEDDRGRALECLDSVRRALASG